MTWNQLITLAINTAVAGTDADNNPIIKQRLEAGGMTDQALQAIADIVAGNPEIRARLEKRFTVALTNGVGTIPAGMLVQFLREGSVKDEDQSMFPSGNPYSRVKFANDFFTDSQLLLGRYCLIDNRVYACQPGIADYTQFSGNLIIDAPFTPTAADMSTTVPDELTNDLVAMLAKHLHRVIVAGPARAA